MAFKERWNRMVRKSVSSNSSGGGNDTAAPKPTPANATTDGAPLAPIATAPASSATGGAPLSKGPSRLAKTLTWRSGKPSDSTSTASDAKPKKPVAPPKKKKLLHPSERPLTEANMRQQELLGAFRMSFGRRRASQGGRTSFSNVSPMGSRQPSVDQGNMPAGHGMGHPGSGGGGPGEQRLSARNWEIPPDVQEEEGSQQTT